MTSYGENMGLEYVTERRREVDNYKRATEYAKQLLAMKPGPWRHSKLQEAIMAEIGFSQEEAYLVVCDLYEDGDLIRKRSGFFFAA